MESVRGQQGQGLTLTSPLFQVLDHRLPEPRSPWMLDDRELGLLTGALNVQSLLTPAATLEAVIVKGGDRGRPVLSGTAVQAPYWPEHRTAVAWVMARSQPGPDVPDGRDRAPRHIQVTIDLGAPAPDVVDLPNPVAARLRRELRVRTPILLDAVRQAVTDRADRHRLTRPVSATPTQVVSRNPPPAPTEKAVLFGLHSLIVGGAEKWALDTIALARDLGARPIVITDQDSPHPLVAHPAMRHALFLPLSLPLPPGQEPALLRAVLDRYDVRVIHVHHGFWLYGRLPWLRVMCPDALILDSVHIEEHRTGGYVNLATIASHAVDIHHTSSPRLRDRLVSDLCVPPEKVALKPLLDLQPVGSDETPARVHRPGVFTVGFVGRMAPQKRPFLFARLAARMAGPNQPYRFVMHGGGELAEETDALIRRWHLDPIMTVRRADVPVERTYADSDVLVNCSENEGLTIASVEASRAGCLLLSTDVGSQSSLNAAELLVPRHPYAFLRAAEAAIRRLFSDPARRERLLTEQQQRTAELESLEGARTWTTRKYEEALR